MNLLTLTNLHKHYGSLLIGLILAVILVTLLKGPKPVFQRVVAVLVDINLVIGLATAWKIAPKSFSLLHPILVLGAVGLLHASAKSDNSAKVIRCFSIALVLLIAAWAVHASWGPQIFKNVWMVNFPGQNIPTTPISQ
jgi:uncharacterized protein YacL